MDLISQLKSEKKNEKAKYKETLKYSNGITQIINQTVDFYTLYLDQIKTFLNNNLINNSTEVFDKIGDKPIAPGLTANDNHKYQNFYNTFNTFNKSLNLSAHILEKDVISQLKEVNNDFHQIYQKITNKVDSDKIQWKQKFTEFQQNSIDLLDLKKRAEELHISYQNNQNEALLQCIKETCEEFIKKKAEYYQTYHQLYNIHQNYIKSIQEATLKLKVSEISRGTQLKSIFFTLQRPIDECSDSFSDIIEDITKPATGWKEDFVHFASSNGIVRQSFCPKEYSQYKFTFSDSRLISPLPCRETLKTYPYAFAILLEDYINNDEVVLKKDERVFIYDSLNSEYSFIQTKEGKQYFIKSSILQQIDQEYKLVIYPYLAKSDKELSVSAGTIVAIKSTEKEQEQEEKILYETVDEKVGFIPPEYFLSDN